MLLVATAALCVLAAGCGGGSDQPLSKTAFVKQGNAVCSKSDEKRNAGFNAYMEKHDVGLAPQEIAEKFVLPSIQEAAEGLDALAAPKGDEKEVEAIVVGIEEGVKRAEKQDPEAFEQVLTPAANLAHEYGLDGCAEVL